MFTKLDAQPILNTLRQVGFNPKLVGSIATKGSSDNDIDILLPIKVEYDNSLFKGLIKRDTQDFKRYYSAMIEQGFECRIAPPFSENDTWLKGTMPVDIWFIQT